MNRVVGRSQQGLLCKFTEAERCEGEIYGYRAVEGLLSTLLPELKVST